MKIDYQIGDLVYIPQAVQLLDYSADDDQLVIPLRVREITQPTLGVVTHILQSGYIQIYCEGNRWSVKHDSLYKV